MRGIPREDTLMGSTNAETNSEGIRSLSCPVCDLPMRVEVVNHTNIDVCEEHGMWLDDGELDRIMLRRSAQGHGKRVRERAKMTRKARLEGWFWGLGSLGRR